MDDKFFKHVVTKLEQLEKISLKEQRDDYIGLQESIEKLEQKYRLIRDQKIRTTRKKIKRKIKL